LGRMQVPFPSNSEFAQWNLSHDVPLSIEAETAKRLNLWLQGEIPAPNSIPVMLSRSSTLR
jgi:hypothetical protein